MNLRTFSIVTNMLGHFRQCALTRTKYLAVLLVASASLAGCGGGGEAQTEAAGGSANDSTGATGTGTGSGAIPIPIVNNAPEISGPTSVLVPENQRLVAMYTVSDVDPPDQLQQTLFGPDVGVFSVVAPATLVFDEPANFEAPADANGDNIYQVTLRTSDGNLSAELEITVQVTDINDNTMSETEMDLAVME